MPGIGLAYKTPEQASAEDFDSTARAVSTPPTSPGIGMATTSQPPVPPLTPAPPPADQGVSPAAPAAAPTPAAAAPAAPAAPAQQAPLLDFHKNPLFAIGMLMSSFAAGVQGKANPLDAYKAQQIEAKAQEYKTASLALDVIDKTSTFVAKMPASQRKAAIADLSQRFGPALGGNDISPFLTAITAGSEEDTAAMIAAAKSLNLSPETMAFISRHPDEGIKLLSSVAQHQATQETPEQAGAKAKAIAVAQGEAGKDKPLTPYEQAQIDAGKTTAEEIRRHNHAEEAVAAATAANKPLTTDQANSATFADRAHEAEDALGKYGHALTSLKDSALESGGAAGRAMQSKDYQLASQAKLNFLTAVLRKESGAAIGKDEIDTADKQYFPQPGDKPEKIAQKARNRATVINGLERSAGASYKRPAAVIQYDAKGNRL